jgi:hypothetical protein
VTKNETALVYALKSPRQRPKRVEVLAFVGVVSGQGGWAVDAGLRPFLGWLPSTRLWLAAHTACAGCELRATRCHAEWAEEAGEKRAEEGAVPFG